MPGTTMRKPMWQVQRPFNCLDPLSLKASVDLVPYTWENRQEVLLVYMVIGQRCPAEETPGYVAATGYDPVF